MFNDVSQTRNGEADVATDGTQILLEPQPPPPSTFEKDTSQIASESDASETVSHEDPELELLGEHSTNSEGIDEYAGVGHIQRTAPVLTGDAITILGDNIIPQRAVYGRVLAQHVSGCPPLSSSPKL